MEHAATPPWQGAGWGIVAILGEDVEAGLTAALASLRGGDRAAASAHLAPLLGRDPDACLRETGPLVALAEELSAATKWRTAHLAYSLLVEAGHRDQEWIAGRVAERAALQDDFIARFHDTAALERLGAFLAQATGHPVASLATTRMRPGLIGMALFRHDIAFADGAAPLSVVEKVMRSDKRDMRRVRAEALLFDNIDAERLMAPRHFGVLVDGPFTSTFQAFFDGAPLPLDRWMATHDELLYRYWAQVPPASLERGPSLVPVFLDRLRDLVAKVVPPAVEPHLRHYSLDDVALILARRHDQLAELLQRMPLFVFHDDMHCGNILVGAEGGMTIIDWDNWALAPIGTGWRFYATDDALPEPDPARIGWARTLPPEATGYNMMRMAALWGWHKALRDSKPELAARWLEKLVRHA